MSDNPEFELFENDDTSDEWDSIDWYDSAEIPCEHCGGTGQDWDLTPCPFCDGEGYQWWL